MIALETALAELCAGLAPLTETSPGFAACADRADAALTRLRRWRDAQALDDDVRWYELTQRGFTLQRTPLMCPRRCASIASSRAPRGYSLPRRWR